MKKIFNIIFIINIIILIVILCQSCTESNVFPYIPSKEAEQVEYSLFPNKVGTKWVYQEKLFEGIHGTELACDTIQIQIISTNYLLPDSAYYLKCEIGKWMQQFGTFDYMGNIYYLLQKDTIKRSNMDKFAPFTAIWAPVVIAKFPMSVNTGWNPGTWDYLEADSAYPISNFKDTAYVANITTIKVNNEWVDAFRIIRKDLFQDVMDVYLYHPKYGIICDTQYVSGVRNSTIFLTSFSTKK